ncbi:hypothetical protein [Siminovitchia terrae]|nr:hypothetical protein [Siminovitchia terrae]
MNAYWYSIQWGFKPWLNKLKSGSKYTKASFGLDYFKGNCKIKT